jgi:signal peptidase II
MSKELKKEKKLSPLKGSNLWGVLLFAILLLIDMVTKLVADAYFSNQPYGTKIEVIPGWINLCITYNRGIAYGIGRDSEAWVKIGVIALTGFLMAGLPFLYFFTDKRRVWFRTAIVFIVAGGLGNLIDRVYYQVWDVETLYGVRDMVDLSRFGFAVCNFADFFICGGAAAMVLSLVFFDKDAMFPLGKYKALAKEGQATKETETAEVVTPVEKNNG